MLCWASRSWWRKPCSFAISCLQASCQWVFYSYHTTTHPVRLIQWMFNGAEHPFILLCCLYLSQREVLDCTCACVYVWLWTYMLHLADFKGFQSEPLILFLFLFAHLSLQQLLFLVFFACSFVSRPIPHTKNISPSSHPSRLCLSFSPYDVCNISTQNLVRLSVVSRCIFKIADGLKLFLPFSPQCFSHFHSPPFSPALSVVSEFRSGCCWQSSPLWHPGHGRSKKHSIFLKVGLLQPVYFKNSTDFELLLPIYL